MITAGPTNGSDLRSSQTKQNEPLNRNLYRPYNTQSNPNQWNACGGGYQDRNWKQKKRAQSSYFSDSEAANQQQEEKVSEETYHKEGINEEQQENQQTGVEDQIETYYQDEFGYHVGTTLLPSSKAYSCRRCSSIFPSNNKLHSHLRKCSHLKRPSYQTEVKAATLASEAFFTDIPIIKSVATANKPNGLAFQSWHFATFAARIDQRGPLEHLCADTGCTMSLIDRKFLKLTAPHVSINQCEREIMVRGIRSCTHQCNKYAIVTIFIPGQTDGRPAVASLTH